MSKLGLGLGWLREVAQGYSYSYAKIELVRNFQKKFNALGHNIGLGLGWPRAAAQCDSHSYNTIELGSNIQKN